MVSADFDSIISLIGLDTLIDVHSISNLTGKVLLEWLGEQDEDSLTSYTLEQIETLVKPHVHMKAHELDANLRFMSLFTD